MLNYSHLVTVHEKDGTTVLRIDRVFENGRKDFYTEIVLPPHDEDHKWDLFDQVASNLGKSICIDSVGLREHYNLNKD